MGEVNLSVVIPLFNESGNINNLFVELQPVLKKITSSYEIVFVDDGSSDDSYEKILKLHEIDPAVKGISLSRNFGHQAALYAGLSNTVGEVVITMDADLQHPPSVIPELYEHYQKGADVVNTIRKDPQSTGIIKKATSRLFYRIINAMSDVRIEPASADFRLMNRKAVDAFLELKEKSRFTRGMVSWIGFRQTFIEYEAAPRFSGKTKYTYRKMIRFASDGITSFSSRPLIFSFYVGGLLLLISLVYAGYSLIEYLFGKTIPGWTSLMVALLVLGSFQLVLLGIIGSYIARIYNESKNRPVYFIREKTDQQ